MIKEFKGKYYFLSNFSSSEIKINGYIFSNAEAAFHSFKDPKSASIFQFLNPSAAKKLGRSVNLRSDWEQIKDEVMYQIVLKKFQFNPELKQQLLDTGTEKLIEGNYWHDNYWGSCFCAKCQNIPGQNKLGMILMKVRDSLKL